MDIKRRKLSEIAKLKIQNCNLSLQILQQQVNQIMVERDKILSFEFKRLRCKFGEWLLDEQTWELFKKGEIKTQSEVKKDGINRLGQTDS